MSRDLEDTNYYISQGGIIPVKWTAPEVCKYVHIIIMKLHFKLIMYHYRPSTTKSTPLPVMCGALVVSCMKYGVSDSNLLNIAQVCILYSS